ncbi:HlyD family efflux transporter periplasmic adaptor subunit [Pseudohongiella sp. SYSU M77423]|uniref:efflux RND transporter periplasmic adaptor subunit n=1 Tax=unclassified Pseudohongiella TaxID=2629611 RepID=UPI000C5728DC|nr:MULTISPECIES: HlyD family efflux transporter periplasmic adaptor subunit [unclassified Pseudohongiella]MAY54654.1 efflux transporter periplasmic adaptor subunit [Gammaproteobacteria bacterium]MEC8861256.1 HlyD family efflux transporter periplasmic adaptor subunit [Pseudomonadota bacterium]HBN15910.1 efflux transporter periplasmic adaptor subunit [Pseudohongiella sp.]MBJ55323.1 efflux transporter periplasmic adaptor subunit [Gammaproteobacteria bacterium]MDH7943802.1 HlyD family efflux trans|tara:strand:- start:541 stop:1815 length:1275 start_codon:yes stop_codon:yes gene_type:complete
MKISDTTSQDTILEPRPRRTRLLWISFGAAVLLMTVWMTAPAIQRWSQAQESVSESRLRLATVTRGDFVRDISVQGRVVAAVSPVLYASDMGTITFAVESGDSVRSGQVLATIDSPELQNRLLQEKSRLASLEVEYQRQNISTQQQQLENQKALDSAGITLKASRRELARAQQAFDQGAYTAVELDRARDDLETAEVLHRHAEMDAELDNNRLEFELQTRQLDVDQQKLLVEDVERQVNSLTLISPVDGIVGNLLVDQKTNVIRNQPVMSVVDLSAFEIEVLVPESYVDDLAIGMVADVRSGNQVNNATLVAISPEIIDNQVTARLRFEQPVPDGLRQNQRLSTRILLEQKQDVLMVPRGQFVESGNGRVAYVVRDGMAYRTPIVMGATSLSSIEILDGLQAGDTIVVSSTDLFNGADTVLINN